MGTVPRHAAVPIAGAEPRLCDAIQQCGPSRCGGYVHPHPVVHTYIRFRHRSVGSGVLRGGSLWQFKGHHSPCSSRIIIRARGWGRSLSLSGWGPSRACSSWASACGLACPSLTLLSGPCAMCVW
eukprot:4724546-Prymnesium_polylepis.1